MAAHPTQRQNQSSGGSQSSGRRYLSASEIGAVGSLAGTDPGSAPAPDDAARPDAQPRRQGAHAGMIHDELFRIARTQPYSIRTMLARGAESVLYRASSGPAVFCVKAIRNCLGRTIGPAETRGSEGLLCTAYRTKARHLRNEYAVGTALAQHGEAAASLVRIYALRKVRRLGLEMGYDLLMELLEGKDMGDKTFARSLTIAERVAILHAAAKALRFMHQHGYVHMDMKPSNLVVSGRTMKLIDFGVTAPIGTMPRAVAGTAGYLSPEQAVRARLDEGIDIFALGITFAVIFGGHPLRQTAEGITTPEFRKEAKYNLESVDQPMVTDLPDLEAYPDLAHVIAQCTIPRRDKRIRNTDMLINRLEHIAATCGFPLADGKA